jgi:hypothetical protein
MIDEDDTTLVTCPMCHGTGEQAYVRDDSALPPPWCPCFLCGGAKAVNAETIMLWRAAGCPQERGQ